jgi:protocatechuate 3,4-dioxygenase beta subunit
MEDRITRRGSLAKMGGLLAALAAGGWKIASSDDEAEGAGPAGVASGAVTCVLTPEQTEGPFYIPRERVRRNITEGRRGVPLALRVLVVDASTCRPIKRAAVDIWHRDAAGAYSGVGGQRNRTFLRGIQRTNAQGVAVFQTIYPGYYQGRTEHIHVKVHLGGNVIHTGHAVLLRRGHGRRLPPCAVQQAAAPDDSQRQRLRLPERRQEVVAAAAQEPHRLRRVDHDGRPAVALNRRSRFAFTSGHSSSVIE